VTKRQLLKKRKPKGSLLWIVDFLNDPKFLPDPAKGKWYGEVSPETINKMVEQNLKANAALTELRPRLIQQLAPIAELPERGTTPAKKRAAQAIQKRRFEALCKLVWAINSQGLRIHFKVSVTPRGAWHVEQDFYPPNTTPELIVTNVYSNLAAALVSGELELLRKCPHCDKFFVALEDRRRRFLPGHMRLYYDDPTVVKERR
jgi:(2Fe-2S) ferredoxin